MPNDKDLKRAIDVTKEDGNVVSVVIKMHANNCSRCHVAADMRVLAKTLVGDPGSVDSWLSIFYQCPSCRMPFLAEFQQQHPRSNAFGRADGVFALRYLSPNLPVPPEVPDSIKKLSPFFYEIFTQATLAENRNLDQICGVGYRKALEVLLKDYCCRKVDVEDDQQMEEAERIKSQFLGPLINNRIENPNIKSMAKRAVWLGNDETHYVRKWEKHDLEDLKNLIALTLKWIDLELTTETYIQDMPG